MFLEVRVVVFSWESWESGGIVCLFFLGLGLGFLLETFIFRYRVCGGIMFEGFTWFLDGGCGFEDV